MSLTNLSYETDEGDNMYEKLRQAGRLSLSDITAATIGDLSNLDQWDGPVISEPAMGPVTEETTLGHAISEVGVRPLGSKASNVPVLHEASFRPVISQINGRSVIPDPGTGPIISEANVEATGPVLRPWEDSNEKLYPTSSLMQVYKDSPPPSYQESLKRRQADNGTHTDFGQPKRPRMASEFDHPSSVVQATQGFKVYTPRLATFEPPQNNVTFLASLQQASMPTSANFTDSGSYNPLLTKTMTNPLVPDNSVKHSGDPVISSHGRSIQSYFPFVQPMQIPVNVKHLGTANSSFLNKGHKQEKQQPSLTNTPVSIKTPDSVFGLYRGMQNSMDNLPYNISSDQSKSYSPALNLVQQTSAHVDTINHYIKPEPVTPVGKEGKVTSYHDNSPAMESRFSESLSNLLGSPPPDSPLSKNPFFGDLQNLLTNECKREIIPQSLFQMTPKQGEELKRENVFARERNLQERFTNLQCKHAEEIRQLSSMFRYQSALIETERFRTLHECQYPGTYKDSVNAHYDNKLHRVMDRVERSVELLENADKENKPAGKIPKPRPHLSKSAVRLMEKWYSENTDHPYPDNTTIELLANTGNIGIEQVKKWFANKRNRSQNTRTLTEIAIQKRKLGLMVNRNLNNNETQFGNEHV